MTKRIITIILFLVGVLCCVILLIAFRKQPIQDELHVTTFTMQSAIEKQEGSVADRPKITLRTDARMQTAMEPYLASLRTLTGDVDERGKPLCTLNEERLRFVMGQEDSTFSPEFYNALMITFENLTMEQKERFVELSYLLTSSERSFSLFGIGGLSYRNVYQLSPVFIKMAALYQAQVEASVVSFDDLRRSKHAIHETLFNAFLLSHLANGIKQVYCLESLSSDDPDRETWSVQVELEPYLEYRFPWDYTLQMPSVYKHVDAELGEHGNATYHFFQFRDNAKSLLKYLATDLLEQQKPTNAIIDRFKQMLLDGQVSFAMHTGACLITALDGQYDLMLVFTDYEALDAVLRAYRDHGLLDGLTAEQIASTIQKDGFSGLAESAKGYIQWYHYSDGRGLAESYLSDEKENGNHPRMFE